MSSTFHTSTHIRTSTRRKGQRLTAEERKQAQEKFIKAFAMSANVRAACMAAGVDRSLVYQWLEKDTEFSILYHEAEKDADDVVRAAIFQRAVHGYEKPVVSMGKVVYGQDGKPLTERVYSDALLALLARARMHEFREKQHIDADINHRGSIETRNAITIDPRSLNPEQVALLKSLATSMKEQEQEQKS